MISKWKEIKYDLQPYFIDCTSFGLPQNAPRLIAMILNVHDPRTLDFAAKSMHAVCVRFRKLCQVCERQHGCASEFLLPDDDPLVLQDLKRRQHIAAKRQPEGYDFNKAIAALKSMNVDWASLKPTPQLESSRWYKTLTRCEQDRLCAVIARNQAHPEDSVFFRDCSAPFGHNGRASNRTEDGLVITRALKKNEQVFIFDKTKPEREPRIVLGWEAMLLCGFPTDIIGKMDLGNFSLHVLARDVMPVPVFMAIFLATLASLPWSDQARNGEIADADDAANSFNADDGDGMSDTEATLKHDMDALDSMRD